ncbi:MAG TPA: hypothetical protein VNI52_13980 [Sphingobacteriaceae bacterium]|nr:hypothetical protein [Sphingobacteriaceae bacterium]
MKNLFKFGFLAFAMALSVAACNSKSTAENADSTLVDSTMMDSTMMDSTGVDTLSLDSATADSAM